MPDRIRDIAEALARSLFPADPGRFRLIAAGRATLGGVLTLAACFAVEPVVPMPFTARVMGFAAAMFLGATVRDPTPHEQGWTIALAPLPLFAIACLVALALPVRYMADLLTVAAVFVVICTTPCGPRWGTLGALSLIGLLVSLLSGLTLAGLPSPLVAIVLGAACAWLVRFVILPTRPDADLRRLLRAVRIDAANLFLAIEQAVRDGGWQHGGRRAMRRLSERLNEAVMLAQPRLPPGPARRLLELQAMTERVVRVALVDLARGAADDRDVLLQLAALRGAIVDGGPPQPTPHCRSKLGRVLATFEELLAESRDDRAVVAMAPAPAPAAHWKMLDVRAGLQAALATALAIAGGELVSPSRWYWAVFAAFVLFQGTRSRSESVAKAWQMLLGTLAGVVVGMVVATLLAGHVNLTMAFILVAVFLSVIASSSYGVLTFWFTIILGLLFGMLGYFPPQLLLLRLEETAAGAAAGTIVAWLVWARRAPDLVREAAAQFLRAMDAVIDAATRPMRGLDGRTDVVRLVVTQETRFQALRSAAPHLPGARLLGPDRTQRLVTLLSACDEWARDLAHTGRRVTRDCNPALSVIAAQAQARISASIAEILARLDRRSAATGRTHEEPAGIPPGMEGEGAALQAVRLLLRLDSTLLHVLQRLGS